MTKLTIEESDRLRTVAMYLDIHGAAVRELSVVAAGAAALLDVAGQRREAEAVRTALHEALDRLNAEMGVDQSRH